MGSQTMEIDSFDDNVNDNEVAVGASLNNTTGRKVYALSNLKAYLRNAMSESPTLITIIPSISIALSYLGTYVAKYPLFLVEYNEDDTIFNIPLKDWLSYAFTVGFFIGKWPAYKFVPSLARSQRLRVLIVLFTLASFFFTAFLPLQGPYSAPIKIISTLIGSISCSAIFGIEFTYLEGRSNGDVYIAALNCVAFFGSSICRAVGTALIRWGVADSWMPILLVVLYAPVTLISLFCLDAIPDPNQADVVSMGERTIMTSMEKSDFITTHIFGLIPLLVGYAFACGFRFLRDFFALELYRDILQREPTPLDYLLADWVGGAFCIVSLLAMSRVTDNARALMLLHCMLAGGGLLMGMTLFMFEREWISPEIWIIMVGVGLVTSITPFSGSLFDRVMGATRTKGTATFLINFADAFAYVGVFSSLAYKTNRTDEDDSSSYLTLFVTGCRAFSVLLLVAGIMSIIYWMRVVKLAEYESVENEEGVCVGTDDSTIAATASDIIALNIEHRTESGSGIAKRTSIKK